MRALAGCAYIWLYEVKPKASWTAVRLRPAPPEVLFRVASTALTSAGGPEFPTCEQQDTSDGAALGFDKVKSSDMDN